MYAFILGSEPDLQIIADAGDGADAAAGIHRPALAILDVAMQRMTGL